MKKTIIWLVIIVIVLLGGYFVLQNLFGTTNTTPKTSEETNTTVATTTSQTTTTQEENKPITVIGTSVEGRDITAYHFGTGDKEILFVAGLHGGYEWNTSLVAYQLVDYLKQNPSAVPAGEKVTVIPVANPDGLYKVTGKEGVFTSADVIASQSTQISGRYNADSIDLNRNFDCDWQPTGKWQNTTVKAGSEPFSEPESAAIRDYVDAHTPTAAIVWYSAAGGVFASSCHNGVMGETTTLTNLFADASGYKAYETFDFYQITGDMVNWLAKNRIPAISVLLTNHTDTEWTKNKAGVTAILNRYATE
jgi:hypothetical protein